MCRTRELLGMSGDGDVPTAVPAPCPGALPVPSWVFRPPGYQWGSLSTPHALPASFEPLWSFAGSQLCVGHSVGGGLEDPCASGDFLTLFSSLPGARSSQGHFSLHPGPFCCLSALPIPWTEVNSPKEQSQDQPCPGHCFSHPQLFPGGGASAKPHEPFPPSSPQGFSSWL